MREEDKKDNLQNEWYMHPLYRTVMQLDGIDSVDMCTAKNEALADVSAKSKRIKFSPMLYQLVFHFTLKDDHLL